MNFLKTKSATVVLFGLLAVVLFMTTKILVQKYQVDKQISQLQDRADRIQSENQQLSDLIKYLNTPQYQEKAAREKLNLKKDGEVVVSLPAAKDDSNADQSQPAQSNPKKWFDYFFGPKS